MAKKKITKKTIESLKREDASRENIPTAEFQSVMRKDEQSPIRVAYERRNRDLDPQLVWRGKDAQDWSDLVVHAPPLYIQEKVHPKVLIDDLRRCIEKDDKAAELQIDLFNNLNGLPDEGAKTEFYQHDANWSNRMILGDSLQVMASLAEREGLRDRFTVARDLLTESESIFVQIGNENVHRVSALMDEVFGEENFITQLLFKKTGSMSGNYVSGIADTILWYGKDKKGTKFRRLLIERSDDAVDSGFGNIELPSGTCRRLTATELSGESPFPDGQRFQTAPLMSSGESKDPQPFQFEGSTYLPAKGNHWKVSLKNLP